MIQAQFNNGLKLRMLVNAATAFKGNGSKHRKIRLALSNTAQTADKAAVGIDQVVTAANQPTSPVNIH